MPQFSEGDARAGDKAGGKYFSGSDWFSQGARKIAKKASFVV
jgi:hypothetical protein